MRGARVAHVHCLGELGGEPGAHRVVPVAIAGPGTRNQ
jgi:hypothetical protein